MMPEAEYQKTVIRLETRVEVLERQVLENQRLAIAGLAKVEDKLGSIERRLSEITIAEHSRDGMLKGAWVTLGAVSAIGAALGISIKQLLSGTLGH